MARKPTKTDELRKQAISVRKNLTAKVRRLERSRGVDITGSTLDVRKSARELNTMNAGQLKKYLRESRTFIKNPVKMSSANPAIPQAALDNYLKVERRFNREARKRLARVADVKMPGDKATIGEQQEVIAKGRMGNESINRPLQEVKRKPENIPSLKALEKLREGLENRLSDEFYGQALDKSREIAVKAMEQAGESEDIIKGVRMMSDDAWDLLYNYSGFATGLFARYSAAISGKEPDRGFKHVIAEAESEMHESMAFATDKFPNVSSWPREQ